MWSEDEPTQEEYDDAMIEDTVHCSRCDCSYVLPEGYVFDGQSVCVECTQEGIDELLEAMERSVSLQSHYAGLLNQYDGGARLTFRNAAEWLRRLAELEKEKPP